MAIEDKVDSILADIHGVLEAELFDSELEAGRELLKKGFLRPAGILAGVTLERHLSNVVSTNRITILKNDPSISDFNDALKKNSIYDVPKWRFVQRLADIRNICGHAKEREPTKEEVDELLNGVEKVIKTFF